MSMRWGKRYLKELQGLVQVLDPGSPVDQDLGDPLVFQFEPLTLHRNIVGSFLDLIDLLSRLNISFFVLDNIQIFFQIISFICQFVDFLQIIFL